jgi:hypothetical protein
MPFTDGPLYVYAVLTGRISLCIKSADLRMYIDVLVYGLFNDATSNSEHTM